MAGRARRGRRGRPDGRARCPLPAARYALVRITWVIKLHMDAYLQGSLFDQSDDISPGPLRGVRRTQLGDGAWIDLLPGWLSGADALFARLAAEVPWQAERRRMYEQVVEVPRLLAFYRADDTLPHPALTEARDALCAHYAAELGEPFRTAGLCYYRDGRDSVAWHGDRTGRGRSEDTMVAILSVGAPRDLLLRPRGGGHTVRRPLGHGDLIVMGGSCQRTWEHAIPKTARSAGPRISVQFRPSGVR
jgi:alkylated DNA repair dioxygenase AlkB